MTDNKDFTPGSGATMATDEIGGVDYPRVKVTWGADGTANDADATNPLPIQGPAAEDAAAAGNPLRMGIHYSATLPTLDDGDIGGWRGSAKGVGYVHILDSSNNIVDPATAAEDSAHSDTDSLMPIAGVRRDAKAVGSGTDGDYSTFNMNAGGDLRVDGGQVYAFESAPAVATSTYVADDCIGGEIEITNAARISGGGGIITQCVAGIEDDDADGWAANDLEVLIFKSNPGGTYTDSTGLAVSDADAWELEGSFLLDTYSDCGNVTLLQASNINLPYICDATSLWAVVVNRGSATGFEDTTSFQIRFKMIRD